VLSSVKLLVLLSSHAEGIQVGSRHNQFNLRLMLFSMAVLEKIYIVKSDWPPYVLRFLFRRLQQILYLFLMSSYLALSRRL
jgi:hypothetical protein